MRKNDIEPGRLYTRAQLHEVFGGSRTRGIVVSTVSSAILLFPDPDGDRNGNFDRVDGGDEYGDLVLYTGEGSIGDQELIGGNAAILNHVKDGRSLMLFVEAGAMRRSSAKIYENLGTYQIDPILPLLRWIAPDRHGKSRLVLIFRLRPVGDSELPPKDFKSRRPLLDLQRRLPNRVREGR